MVRRAITAKTLDNIGLDNVVRELRAAMDTIAFRKRTNGKHDQAALIAEYSKQLRTMTEKLIKDVQAINDGSTGF